MSFRLVVPAIVASLLVGVTPSYTAAVEDSSGPSWTQPSRPPQMGGPGEIVSNGRGVGLSGSMLRGLDGNWRDSGLRSSLAWYQGAVVDAHGNATVAWSEGGWCADVSDDYQSRGETPATLRTAVRSRSGAIRQLPFRWQSKSCLGPSLDLAADDRGTVTMLFEDANQIFATARPAGGRWERPVLIGSGDHFDVDIDAGGRPVAVWTNRDRGVVAAVRTRGGAWSKRVRIDPPEGDGSAPSYRDLQLLRSSGGSLRVLWLERAARFGGAFRLRSAAKDPKREWGAAETIAKTGQDQAVTGTDLALAGDTPTVIWLTTESTATPDGSREHWTQTVKTSTRLNGRWRAPVVLDDSLEGPTGDVSVAGNRLGVMAVWHRGGHTYAALEGSSGRWGEPVRLSRSGSSMLAGPTVVAYRPDMFTATFRDGKRQVFADYVDDRRPPTTWMTGPRPSFTVYGTTGFTWDTKDDRTGTATVDMRGRTAGRNGKFSRWSMWLRNFERSVRYRELKPGQTKCVSVRARDHQGNVGRWSKPHCATAAFDDRMLARSPGWSNLPNREATYATLTRTHKYGARLILRGVGARQIAIMARSCPRCGSVEVIHAGERLGRVDLTTPRFRDQRVFRLKRRARLLRGPLVVRVVSRGKPVQIDGLIARP